MPFEKGNKLATGRPKGSLGDRKRRVETLCKDLDVDPMEILLRFAKGDWKGLGYKSETVTKYSGETHWEEERISSSERIQAAKEAAQYVYSKLKTIEVIKENQFEGMTLEEKLQAMRQAVQVMEKMIASEGKQILEAKK